MFYFPSILLTDCDAQLTLKSIKNSPHPKVSEDEILPSQYWTRNFHICGSSSLFKDQAHLLYMWVWIDSQLEWFGKPRTLGPNIFPLEIFTLASSNWWTQGQICVLFGCHSVSIWIWMSLCRLRPLYFDIIPITSYCLVYILIQTMVLSTGL